MIFSWDAQNNLNSRLAQRTELLRQKSRASWLKDGDRIFPQEIRASKCVISSMVIVYLGPTKKELYEGGIRFFFFYYDISSRWSLSQPQ